MQSHGGTSSWEKMHWEPKGLNPSLWLCCQLNITLPWQSNTILGFQLPHLKDLELMDEVFCICQACKNHWMDTWETEGSQINLEKCYRLLKTRSAKWYAMIFLWLCQDWCYNFSSLKKPGALNCAFFFFKEVYLLSVALRMFMNGHFILKLNA